MTGLLRKWNAQCGHQGRCESGREGSILDVIQPVHLIVAKDSAPAAGSTAFKNADASADSSIDITDVITQVNQTLGISPKLIAKGPSAPVVVTFSVPESDADGPLMMPFVVPSNGVIAAMQATRVFDPLQVPVEGPIISGHSASLGLDYHITDGTLRLVIYSLKRGQGLSAGPGTVVHMPVTPLADGARLTTIRRCVWAPLSSFCSVSVFILRVFPTSPCCKFFLVYNARTVYHN
jgi:hypothetical protein